MDGQQLSAAYFAHVEHMSDVSAGIIAAAIAVAPLFHGREVLFVRAVADGDVAAAGKRRAVARHARGKHAVEHIYSAEHAFHYAVGRPHAHKIDGLVLRIIRTDNVQHFIHDFLGLAYGKPAYRHSALCKRRGSLYAFNAQIFVQIALHYGEKHLIFARMRLDAPLQPRKSALHCARRFTIIRARRRTFVKRHDYVRAELLFYLYCRFGREIVRRTVVIRGKFHAVVGDFAHGRKGKYLKTAAVSQNGSVPIHEPVQSPGALHYVASRTQIQMVGVGQHYLRARFLNLFGSKPLYPRVRAHGHVYGGDYLPVRRGKPAYPRARLLACVYYFIPKHNSII